MAIRVICVKAPRGLRGLIRLFVRNRKTENCPTPRLHWSGVFISRFYWFERNGAGKKNAHIE